MRNLGYHVIILRDGTALKTMDFETRVHHAGKASWKEFSPNQYFLGVAFTSYGLVKRRGEQFFAWPNDWRKEMFGDEVLYNRSSISEQQRYWEAAPTAQVTKLLEVLSSLIEQYNIDPEMICGHDECAPDRKLDPGGCLMMTMQEVRDVLGKEREWN